MLLLMFPSSGGNTASVSLTTALPNDIIIVSSCSGLNNVTASTPTDNFNGGGGLTWNLFTNLNGRNDGAARFTVWWAKAPSVITSGSVTVNYSGNTSIFLEVFAVNGADLVSPEDGNAALPAVVFSGTSYTFSTTNANTFVFGFTNGGYTATTLAGWADIDTGLGIQNSYRIFNNSIQTSVTVTPWASFTGGLAYLTAVKASVAIPVTLVLGDYVLDSGIAGFDAVCDKIYICSQQPTTYTEAINTFALGNKNWGAGAAYTTVAPQTGGRQITSIAITDGVVTANGTPAAWAAVDSAGSQLLASGNMAAATPITSGQVFTLSPMTIYIPAT